MDMANTTSRQGPMYCLSIGPTSCAPRPDKASAHMKMFIRKGTNTRNKLAGFLVETWWKYHMKTLPPLSHMNNLTIYKKDPLLQPKFKRIGQSYLPFPINAAVGSLTD